MEYVVYKREDSLRDYDAIFISLADFNKARPVHFPRITGVWRICFLDFRYDDLEKLENFIPAPFQEITIRARKEFLFQLGKLSKATDVSPYDRFMKEQIANFPYTIDSKAATEIYRRCKTPEARQDVLDLLEQDGINPVRIKDIDAIVPKDDSVYASDIAAMIFMFGMSVPKKGHTLSRYRYRKFSQYLDKFLTDLGDEYAFYSLRKYMRNLLECKIKYLKNKDQELNSVQTILIREVDIYTLYYIVFLFNRSVPLSVLACINDCCKRVQGEGKLLEVD